MQVRDSVRSECFPFRTEPFRSGTVALRSDGELEASEPAVLESLWFEYQKLPGPALSNPAREHLSLTRTRLAGGGREKGGRSPPFLDTT